ncbi:hypothetical protein NL676_002003 [Syzygium grande]|nr:hypothetical protein NL676_002003 [Syzygium grande]
MHSEILLRSVPTVFYFTVSSRHNPGVQASGSNHGFSSPERQISRFGDHPSSASPPFLAFLVSMSLPKILAAELEIWVVLV